MTEQDLVEIQDARNTSNSVPWNSLEQPWGQYARLPTHNGTMPNHGPDGGPGSGDVDNVTKFGIIDNPVINWVAIDDSDNNPQDGSDLYGSIIADFSASVNIEGTAQDRCATGDLFAVVVYSESGTSKMAIITGDDAKIAWEVEIGDTLPIRTTPMLIDVDQDGRQEILIAYDTNAALKVDMWAPDLSCSESGWQKSGHSTEKLWSLTDSDYRLSKTSPHFWADDLSPQPLLADLSLDGSPELVLALNEQSTDDPTITSLSLTTSAPTTFDWEINLDKGTHASDPAWAMLDDDTTAIMVTTMDENSGNMWIWKIDGSSGSLDWDSFPVPGTDFNPSETLMWKLPGPVIVQLDSDSAPEMILTIPTDPNDEAAGNGAKFVAMETTSTTEIWNFRTPNGWADTHPLPIDTDGDGIHDRLCWITWTSESWNTNRIGITGCHDITSDPPTREWSKDMDNDNGKGDNEDEVAIAPPLWMDINGDQYPELIVAYANRLWAYDGEDGTSAGVSSQWSSPIDLPHRVFAAPAVADMDGDGTLDILIGDTLVSQLAPDFAPLSDNRGITFNPSQPDPGNLVTVTGQFSNIGTMENEDDVDVVLLQNGNEIKRERFSQVAVVAPTGNGGPYTFSVDITAELGIHTFEMILDVNDNLTEAREDNNRVTTELVIVEPYASQIDIPNTIPRIEPGGSQIISISMLSTGSRTESWTLTWDDSNLPEGWSFQSDNGQNNNPTLIPGIAQNFDFLASVPADALGDDNSYVGLTLTLDSNNDVSSTATLPIEVLRTRGLSIVGPTGLGMTEGYGIPGNTATAWIVVENLGNANEATTSIDWTAPSWGGTPTLNEANGDEVYSLNLAPGEMKELFVNLDVPMSANLGSSTTTTLTICVGSSSDALCEDINVNLTSTSITIQEIHTRTLPNVSLSWNVAGTLPGDGNISWNMISANMIQQDWIWSVDGDLAISGSNIHSTGTQDSAISGNIYLTLPVNALPQRHTFSIPSSGDMYHDLYFTMHVLQIYRSDFTILQPTQSQPNVPISLIVEQSNQVSLRLENPGNGQDNFLLEASAISGPEMSSPAIVDFDITIPQKSLGPLATSISYVGVTISEDTPAQEPFILRFRLTSLGNESVYREIDLLVEAEPDHSWDVQFVNGLDYQVTPGESVSVGFTAKNTGNAVDNVSIMPTLTPNYFGQDSSIWAAQDIEYDGIEINQTVSLNLEFTVPDDAWSGTVTTVKLDIYSGEIYVSSENLTFEVQTISGWKFNLSDTNLIIDPNGQNLTLQFEHLGNLATVPYFAKAGQGWNTSVPNSGEIVEPYGTSTVTVFVTPPEGVLAGEIELISISIRNGDGSAEVIEQIPVRVGASPEINLASKGNWLVTNEGGMPNAWIENLGNDIPLLSLSVSGIPTDWETNLPNTVVMTPNQVIGIPINVIPSNGWDGSSIIATVSVSHPVIGTQTIDLTIVNSNISFLETPVVSGIFTDTRVISLSQINSSPEGVDSTIVSISDNQATITFPSTRTNTSFTDSNIEVNMHVIGYQLPQVSASCSITKSSLDELGLVSLTGKIGTCQITASQQEIAVGSLVLTTNRGEIIPINGVQFTVPAGETRTYDLNVSNWKPAAGIFTTTIKVIDSYGRELTSDSQTTTARSTGWNIGISEISANDDIRIGITRTSYERLVGVICKLEVTSSNNLFAETYIIDIGGIDYAPTIRIDSPDVLKTDDTITARLGCESPYDIDDNPDDDEAQTFYKESKQEIIQTSDVAISIAIAVILVVIAYFAGFMGVNSGRTTTTRKVRDETVEKLEESVEENIDIDEELDDFSFQLEEDSNDDVGLQIEEEEVIDIPEEIEVDDSASGRLASLRSEILDDGPVKDSRPLRDRMDDFFNR